jgi:Na+/H+ antiporter NhaD/arsenite permease-like protein
MLVVGFVAHRRWAAARARPAPALALAAVGGPAGAVGHLPGDDGLLPGWTDDGDPAADRRALRVGGLVVAALLVAFVVGPAVGVPAWAAILVADAVLVLVCRSVPWRTVPVATAAGVAVLAAAVAVLVPGDHLGALVDRGGAVGALVGSVTGAVLAAAVDNLPALLALLQGVTHDAAVLPVLLGVNAGAVLTPIGSLANLLWLRTARRHGLDVSWRGVLSVGLRVGGPALAAGIAALALQRALTG